MSSPNDEHVRLRMRAELISLCAEFPRWLCWPHPPGQWYALELGFWFPDPEELPVFRASSPADLRQWLRGFEDHAHTWQASRRASGLPPADPPVPDLPRVRPVTLDLPALIAALHEALNILCPDPIMAPPCMAELPLPAWLVADWTGNGLAAPGGRPADGCRRHHPLPVSRRTGPGCAHREHR